MNLKPLAAAVLSLLALAIPAAQAQASDDNTAQELARARAEVEKAREELRKATRDLARSMAKAEKDSPRAEYFNLIANPRRAMLGVIINDDKDDDGERGVTVLAVTPGGGAEKAGLKAGDLITGVNGQSLMKGGRRLPQQKLREVMRQLAAGDVAQLDYERDGKRASASVTTQAPEPDMALSLPMLPPWADGDFEMEKLGPMASMHHFRGAAIRGLELARLDEDLGSYFKTREGVLVVKAPKTGGLSLKSGDVIQKIDGAAVTEPVTVLDKLRSRSAEQDVRLDVLRHGRKVQIDGKIPVALAAPRRGERRRHADVIVDQPDDDGDN